MPARKVVFLHPHWQKGGVEQTNQRWAEIFAKRGYENFAVTWDGSADKALYGNMRVLNTTGEIAAYRQLNKILRRNDILIICQSYFLLRAVFVVWWLRLRRVTTILAERNSFDQYNDYPIKKRVYARVFPWLFASFHHIIVNAQEMAEEAVFAKVRTRLQVFRNPRFSDEDLTLIEQNMNRQTAQSVYTFCRWASQKDPEFIHSAAQIFAAHGVRFDVYCDEAAFSYQKPFVANALRFMAENPSIVFFCSKFEGYPNLLVEARALGLPIIYAHCKTGVSEILDDYPMAFRFEKEKPDTLIAAYQAAIARMGPCEIDMGFAEAHSVAKSDKKLFEYIV